MIGRGHAQRRTLQTKELSPKGADEDGVTVGDYTPREPVKFAYHIHEEAGNFEGCELGG